YERRRHANHTTDVDVHFRHQFRQVGRRDFEVLIEHDARVVHQHVELRELRFHTCSQCGNLRNIPYITLDGVELRVLRLHLIQYRLAATGHDDLVPKFEELEGESKADARRAPGDEDGA